MYKQGPLHSDREHSVGTCKTEQGIDNKGKRGYSNSSSKGQKNKSNIERPTREKHYIGEGGEYSVCFDELLRLEVAEDGEIPQSSRHPMLHEQQYIRRS